MKRIQSACLEQTIHFTCTDSVSPDLAEGAVRHEVEQYKAGLDRRNVKYKIIDESVQADGSMIVKLKRQYNFYHCGSYLD